MNYFKYQCQSSLGKVWPLFKELRNAGKESIEGRQSEFGHTSEILNSAINGNIYSENFNLRAYEYRCSENDKNMEYKTSSKFLAVIDADELERNPKSKSYTVLSETLGEEEEKFLDLEEDSDFVNNLNGLLSLQKDLIINEGIDPISVLKNAISGVPSAIVTLRSIANDDVKDIIYSLCEVGKGRLQSYLEQYV